MAGSQPRPAAEFTSIRQIRSLSRAEANQAPRVHLRGVVTFRDNDGFFIRDSDEAVAVDAPKLAQQVKPGDLIDLRGTTVAGGFAPQVEAGEITVLGTAPIGPFATPTFEQMATAEFDSQLIRLEGTVHAVTSDEGNTALNVAVSGGRVLVRVPSLGREAAEKLIDTRISVTGNCGAVFNERNQRIGVRLYVPSSDNIVVQVKPSFVPLFKISELDSFNRRLPASHRVRIHGSVTFSDSDGVLIVTDRSDGIFVRISHKAASLHPGDEVEVLGFVAAGQYTTILEDAVVRYLAPGRPPAPATVTVHELLKGNYDAGLVQIDGRMLGHSKHRNRNILSLQSGSETFDAEMPAAAHRLLQLPPEGSAVRLVGVCQIEADESGTPVGFRLLLRSPEDIVVLSRPSWWTLPKLLAVSVMLAALIALALAWVVALRRRVNEQTSLIRTTLESTGEGILVTDLQGVVLACNRKYLNLWNLGDKQIHSLLHQDLVRIAAAPLRDAEGAAARVQELYADRTLHADDALEFVDGRTYERHSEPLLVGSRPLGRVWAYRDATQTRLAQVELRRAKDAAESANRAKSSFLAAMSHEIRTPMNAILGMADLLAETQLSADQANYVEVFRRAGANLLALINDILDFSKIESGQFKLESISFDLQDVIDRTIELIRPKVVSKGIVLNLHVDPKTPTALLGDPVRLQQILLNLLGNATKFTEQGSITLSISPAPPLQQEKAIEFDIADTGIGIPADQLKSIFDDFTQADSSTTRKYGGTGLGLGISRRLVDMMGGVLIARSTPGEGSSFHFTAVFKPGDPIFPASPAVLEDLRDRRALIIDDNATNRMIFRERLLSWGLQVTECASGREALEALKTVAALGNPFSILLLDMNIPGENTFRTATEIRLIAPDLPIVILTSDNRSGDATRWSALNISHYAIKPVLSNELLRLLRDAIKPRPTVQPDVPRARESQTHAAQSTQNEAEALHILIADDSPDNRFLVRAYLTPTGYRLTFVENGQQALDAFQRDSFNLILMDVQMPVMDGLTAVRLIRELEQRQDRIPTAVIALTANALPTDIQASKEAGCNGHLAKPISKQKLLNAITENSSQRKQYGSSVV